MMRRFPDRVKSVAAVVVVSLLTVANVAVQSVPAAALAPVVAPAIALGRHHGCMLVPDGTVRCWGRGTVQTLRVNLVTTTGPRLARAGRSNGASGRFDGRDGDCGGRVANVCDCC